MTRTSLPPQWGVDEVQHAETTARTKTRLALEGFIAHDRYPALVAALDDAATTASGSRPS